MVARTVVLVLALAVAGALFARRARLLTRLVNLGRPIDRQRRREPARARGRPGRSLGQRKLFQRALPGLMHACIFWGFLILLTTIVEALGQAIDPDFALPLIGHAGWLGLLQDVFAALVLVGIGIAVWIRVVQRPERFVGSHRLDAFRILGLITWIILTLFLLRGARIALGDVVYPSAWTPISTAVSHLFTWMSESWQSFFAWFFLWAHIALVLGFLVYLPYSKHLHIITSAINVWFASTRPRGALEPLRIDMEKLESGEQSLGAQTLTDLTRKELLDLYACTECGRCQSVCPAWNTGKPLSPKLLIMDLRDHLLDEGPNVLQMLAAGETPEQIALVPGIVDDDVVWSCTTCGACVQECPVDIEHVDTIVDLRRALVMGESRFPAEAGAMMRNLESRSNPWGVAQSQRADWAEGMDVPVVNGAAPEYLYWVGCAGSFDERARDISRAVADLLQRAGVSFAILGPRELCTGDPARRMGNEFLFQTLAEQNVETHERGRGHQGHRELPALLQHAPQRVPAVRRELRGHPPHGAARSAGGGGPAPPDGAGGDPPRVPRPVLPGAPQPGVRRAPRRPGRHPRGPHGGDAAPQGTRDVLRCRGSADVDGGRDRQAHQHRTDGRGGGDRCRHRRCGLPVLPHHARRRGEGPG